MNENQLFQAKFPVTGLSILQDKSAFCFGIDAVLLADFSSEKKAGHIFDLGSGTGIIPLLMAKTCDWGSFTALEIQKDFVDIARLNVKNNNLEERIKVVEGNIKDISSLFPPECADAITSNPPYAKADAVRKNSSQAKNIARHEVLCNLEDVVKGAAWLLKSGASFYMIHRPERLAEIFALFSKYRLEPKRLQLLQSFADSKADMVLIEGRKNARPQLNVLPSLVIYEEKGRYSEAVKKIYSKY